MTMDAISPLSGIPTANPSPSSSVAEPSSPARSTFGTILKDQLREVNLEQLNADNAVQNLAVGKSDNVHETVMSVVQADLSLRMIIEVRNRLIESYQEIMRMQI
jgi:flagellar hook-basal body complex protein FliE